MYHYHSFYHNEAKEEYRVVWEHATNEKMFAVMKVSGSKFKTLKFWKGEMAQTVSRWNTLLIPDPDPATITIVTGTANQFAKEMDINPKQGETAIFNMLKLN